MVFSSSHSLNDAFNGAFNLLSRQSGGERDLQKGPWALELPQKRDKNLGERVL